MATSDALKKAIKKYEQEKVDRIMLRVPKGKKEIIHEHATRNGESLNAFLNRAIDTTMLQDDHNAN